MSNLKRFITEELERKAFEDIVRNVIMKYKDNVMCSGEIMETIITESTKEIREQLTGLSRKYIEKDTE